MSQPSIVILAHRGDVGAVALATLLRRRGRCRVDLVDGQALSAAVFAHRPDSGRVGGVADQSPQLDRVRLPGGGVIDAGTDVVLCRLPMFPVPRFASTADQEYAEQELFALSLSWLHGLGAVVVNSPSPRGLAGMTPDVLSLPGLARSAGLGAARIRLCSNGAGVSHTPNSSGSMRWRRQRWDGAYVPLAADVSRRAAPTADGLASASQGPPLPMPVLMMEAISAPSTALVCGDIVVGAPAGLERPTVALVVAAGLDVAEVGFGVPVDRGGRDAGPVVVGVNPVPGLGGNGHLIAIAHHLETRALRRDATRNRSAAGEFIAHQSQEVVA